MTVQSKRYPACEAGEHEKCAGCNNTGRYETFCECECHKPINWGKLNDELLEKAIEQADND